MAVNDDDNEELARAIALSLQGSNDPLEDNLEKTDLSEDTVDVKVCILCRQL